MARYGAPSSYGRMVQGPGLVACRRRWRSVSVMISDVMVIFEGNRRDDEIRHQRAAVVVPGRGLPSGADPTKRLHGVVLGLVPGGPGVPLLQLREGDLVHVIPAGILGRVVADDLLNDADGPLALGSH
jgi:hypothetical protein